MITDVIWNSVSLCVFCFCFVLCGFFLLLLLPLNIKRAYLPLCAYTFAFYSPSLNNTFGRLLFKTSTSPLIPVRVVNIWDRYKHLCSACRSLFRAKGGWRSGGSNLSIDTETICILIPFLCAHGSITAAASYSNAPASGKARRGAAAPAAGKKHSDVVF